jgi:hypothetical protein
MILFLKEHLVPLKEALIFKGDKLIDRVVKECDLQCYPIYPRHNPNKNRQTFRFGI